MPNRIRDVVVLNHKLDPIATELNIVVEVENLTPGTQIKGRLMGPRSAYSSTVEIAYSLTEIERSKQIVLRAIIPEPSWWEPKTPFLYQGPLELWQDGELRERVEISHGIRAVQITSKGLNLNGKPFILRGRVIEQTCTEADLQQVHNQGFNMVLAPLRLTNTDLWKMTDRYGLLVLSRSDSRSDIRMLNQQLHRNASALGWVVDRGILDESVIMRQVQGDWVPSKLWFGVEATALPIPAQAGFVIGKEKELAGVTDVALPKIVLTNHLSEPLPTGPDLIGWVESP